MSPCLPPTSGHPPSPFSCSETILFKQKKNDKVTHKLNCFSHCSVSDRLLEKLGEEVLLLYFCYSVLIRRKLSGGARTGSQEALTVPTGMKATSDEVSGFPGTAF